MNMNDLNERSIIVTGGASGIGAEAARRAAARGARVTVADLSVEAGQAVVAAIRADGGEAQFVRTDISVEDDVRRLVEEAVAAYGGLDGAFNNAGLPPFSSARNGMHPLAGLPAEAVTRSLQVNVLGCFLCLKYEIPAMLASGGGAIVNTSSANGLVAIPFSADYIAAKHAVIGLTKAAATDYATQGIRVNAILPGIIRTPMMLTATGGDAEAVDSFRKAMPIDRLGEPGEIAEVALYLLTDSASLMTGASVSVDGGQTAV